MSWSKPSHALQFDGRRHFKLSGEMMAKITAAHLAEQPLSVMKVEPMALLGSGSS
jgi:hypothetical protein